MSLDTEWSGGSSFWSFGIKRHWDAGCIFCRQTWNNDGLSIAKNELILTACEDAISVDIIDESIAISGDAEELLYELHRPKVFPDSKLWTLYLELTQDDFWSELWLSDVACSTYVDEVFLEDMSLLCCLSSTFRVKREVRWDCFLSGNQFYRISWCMDAFGPSVIVLFISYCH